MKTHAWHTQKNLCCFESDRLHKFGGHRRRRKRQSERKVRKQRKELRSICQLSARQTDRQTNRKNEVNGHGRTCKTSTTPSFLAVPSSPLPRCPPLLLFGIWGGGEKKRGGKNTVCPLVPLRLGLPHTHTRYSSFLSVCLSMPSLSRTVTEPSPVWQRGVLGERERRTSSVSRQRRKGRKTEREKNFKLPLTLFLFCPSLVLCSVGLWLSDTRTVRSNISLLVVRSLKRTFTKFPCFFCSFSSFA